MKTSIKHGISVGATFAIILLFLALTGFTDTGAALLAKILGQAPAAGGQPGTFFFVLFMALIELWNGIAAARKTEFWARTLQTSLVSGLAAGVFTGVIIAGFALIYGSLLAKNVDPRPYLSMVSPDAMRLFLFELSSETGPFFT